MAEDRKDKTPNNSDNNKGGKGNKPKFNIYWVYGLIALAFLGINFMDWGGTPQEITWLRFKNEMLQEHDVDKVVVINKEKAEVYLKSQAINSNKYQDIRDQNFSTTGESGPHYFFTIGSVETFANRMEDAQKDFNEDEIVPIKYETHRDILGELLTWLFPLIILVAIWIFIFRRMGGAGGGGAGGGGNIFSIGKSKAKIFDKEGAHVQVNFNDVAGLSEAKTEIREIVQFLKNPSKYTTLGGKIPKGALLVGPPGTGKTLLARAVAGEADVPFFSMSGSDFVEMFVGVGASRVRDLFNQAKEKAPCIVFIDEVDAIGRARGKNPSMGANDERENTLNQLLTEMDGFDTNTGVIILAATNRPDILDKALLRAGRFDRQVHVELPDLNERQEIFKVHMKPIKTAQNLDVEFLAKQTPGFSGADIANVCNESALIAARKDHKEVTRQDFLDAVDRIIGGLEKKNKVITPQEKKIIAYHESGHATVSWLLKHAHPLVKVTIVPRGQALGAAWYLPEERQITTREQMIDEMCAALGGRVAEEVFFGEISTGALNDLEKITKQAYAMITYYGMSSKLGNISFYDSTGQNEYAFNKPYSDKTSEVIDKEVSQLVDYAYQRAKRLLLQNKQGLDQLAQKLLEEEVIFTHDVERIFGSRLFDENGILIPREKRTEEQEKQAKEAQDLDESAKRAAEEKIAAEKENQEIENQKPDDTTENTEEQPPPASEEQNTQKEQEENHSESLNNKNEDSNSEADGNGDDNEKSPKR